MSNKKWLCARDYTGRNLTLDLKLIAGLPNIFNIINNGTKVPIFGLVFMVPSSFAENILINVLSFGDA